MWSNEKVMIPFIFCHANVVQHLLKYGRKIMWFSLMSKVLITFDSESSRPEFVYRIKCHSFTQRHEKHADFISKWHA